MEKRQVGVYGILTKTSQILLVLKTRGPYQGKLDLPGGGIQHGEELETALRRELNEEIGLVSSKVCLSFFDAITYSTSYQENGSLISFDHIGLIYQVSNFKEEDLNFSIEQKDVKGAEWIDFSIECDRLSPFALHVTKKLRQ